MEVTSEDDDTLRLFFFFLIVSIQACVMGKIPLIKFRLEIYSKSFLFYSTPVQMLHTCSAGSIVHFWACCAAESSLDLGNGPF